MTEPVHFILTGGDLTWQYRRALSTAAVHGRPRILWHVGGTPQRVPDGVRTAAIQVGADLSGAPEAHIWDMLAYRLVHDYGGTAVGLDTISVRQMEPLPLWAELGVGLDVPAWPYWHPDKQIWVDHPYNNNGISARKGSTLAAWLHEEALFRLRRGAAEWGATGPGLLTEVVTANTDRVMVAPFPQLCGWEGSHIWRFYQGLEQPAEDVRVIHLFATAYPQEFASYGQEAA